MPLFYTVPQHAGGFRRGNQARGLAPEPTPTRMGFPCLYGGRGFRPDFAPARIGPLFPFPHFSYLKILTRRAGGPACRADVGSWRGFAHQHGVAPETLPPHARGGTAQPPFRIKRHGAPPHAHFGTGSPSQNVFSPPLPLPEGPAPSGTRRCPARVSPSRRAMQPA